VTQAHPDDELQTALSLLEKVPISLAITDECWTADGPFAMIRVETITYPILHCYNRSAKEIVRALVALRPSLVWALGRIHQLSNPGACP
jgi:hypothetical protein